MTVVIGKHDCTAPSRHDHRCSLCEGYLHYPFLHWSQEIFICGDCCRGIKRGLIADLIQIVAILELHDQGYHSMTFDRRSLRTLEEETERQWAEENQIICKLKGGA
jgi:hypothetical protein